MPRLLRITIMYIICLCLILNACRKKEPELTPTPIPAKEVPIESTPLPGQIIFYVAAAGKDSNPGTLELPWATINHAAEVLTSGQTVYVRDGIYKLARRILVKNSGTELAWITFAAYPGEFAVFDASDIDIGNPSTYPHDQGTFQIERVSYIRVIGLVIHKSHQAGFMIRDSHHVELYNNITDTTFSPGIAAWDTNQDSQGTEYIKIMGNTVTNANTWDMLPKGYQREGEPPHEAISIAGAQNFEVAYNYLYNSDKEGIDVKEVSKHGKVHHNFIDHMDRQGLYVDAWFGAIEDIEIYENVVRNCRGAGLILSVENGKSVSDVRVHHNLIINNQGTGIFFSRWGDGPRSNIKIYNNTVYHNGYGSPNAGEKYFWITGGLYLFSNNLEDIDIRNNIFADNRAFQIAYSDHWLKIDVDFQKAFEAKKIVIANNLIFDQNKETYPVYVGWPPDMYANAWAVEGSNPVVGNPKFVSPPDGNYSLQPGSPAVDAGDPGTGASGGVARTDPDGSPVDIGAFPLYEPYEMWWVDNFPPEVKP
jgi:hypothetical protein